jgi:hypothetical protein
MNPLNQFIKIAADCPTEMEVIPQSKTEKQSVAVIEYALLSAKPYHYTLEKLQFAVHLLHK